MYLGDKWEHLFRWATSGCARRRPSARRGAHWLELPVHDLWVFAAPA